MTQRRHDWDYLERRWIAGEWQTLNEMAKQTGITIRMVQKNSAIRKWRDKKQQVDDAANEEAMRRLGLSIGKKIAEANERALKMAKILQQRGLSRFLDEHGNMTKLPMESDASAVTAIRAGIAIEQAILKGQQLDGAAPAGNTNVNLFAMQQNNFNPQEMTDEQLAGIIRDTGKRIRELESGAAAKIPKRRSAKPRRKKKSKKRSS